MDDSLARNAAPRPDLSGRTAIRGVRDELRAATRDCHASVDLAFGSFGFDTIGDYTRFLQSHARILPLAEAAIAPRELLAGWIERTDALRADLAALGEAMPRPIDFTLAAGDGARWGALYVIEGSRLGGAMLARRVPEGWPKAYLSAEHAGGWQRVIDALERADGGAAWRADAVAGARAMFDAYNAAAAHEKAVS